jgi:hypothetical protein
MDNEAPGRNEWITRVLGIEVPSAAPPSPAATAPTPPAAQAVAPPPPAAAPADDEALAEWLDDLRGQASVLAPPVREAMLARVQQARAAPDAAAVSTLAEAIADAAKAARTAAAAAAAGNTVTYRLLCEQWQHAQAASRQQLDAFIDALLGDTDLQADARYPGLQAEANGLATLIPDDAGTLALMLRQFDDAAEGPARSAAKKNAQAALARYRADLAAVEALRQMQELANDLFGAEPFLTGLQTSLAELDTQLDRHA